MGNVLKGFNQFGVFLLGVVWLQGFSQTNLVPNAGFESFKNKRGNTITNAPPWRGIATVDFYLAPIPGDTSRYKGALEGSCYAGLRYQKSYKEFLTVKLTKALKKDELYYVEFHIRLAHWSNAYLRSMGAYLSKKPFRINDPRPETGLIDSVSREGLDDNGAWIKISGTYQAQGGEKLLTIGNFNAIKRDMLKKNIFKLGFKEAYYFVDKIKVISTTDTLPPVVNKPVITSKPDSVKEPYADLDKGMVIQIPNIEFETGKATLLPQSYPSLNTLAEYLMAKPQLKLQINGHTDNVGSEKKNQKLSEERARVVFEYLLEKGVPNRLQYKGFGSKQPLSENETEQGRAKNRRVEMVIQAQ